MRPADDEAHQIDAGREQQFVLVLPLCGALEQAVQRRRIERRFQNRPRRHANRGLLDEPVENLAQQHPCRLPGI